MSGELQKSPVTGEQLGRLAATGQLYAVVDACKEPEVPPKCKSLGERAVSLYRGGAEEQYADIAPYLVAMDAAVLSWVKQRLWPRPWGIFIYSDAALEALRTHLRHFLKVKDEQGKQYFFRFYDPRILPPFLESSNREELRQFFGPVRAYGVGEGDGGLFFRGA